MVNFEVDDDRSFWDRKGNRIGKVDNDNHIRDGYQDKGYLTKDGQYVDEYGTNQGWAVRSYRTRENDSSYTLSESVSGFVSLVVMGVEAGLKLMEWLSNERRKQKKLTQVNEFQVKEPLIKGNVVFQITPDIRIPFQYIPSGEFLMGNDKSARDQIGYEHLSRISTLVYLSDFWMAKYPTTNKQFHYFVKQTDYQTRWVYPGKEYDEYSARNILYVDAYNYCRWLSKVTGHYIQVPTEGQWEKAARGTDGRFWPWGNEYPNKNRCSWSHEAIKPVGFYSPQGDSPYGCADMAGNVHEWTSSLLYDYPYHPGDERDNPDPNAGQGGGGPRTLRAVRGGSCQNGNFINITTYKRHTCNDYQDPDIPYTGFRPVCVS